jgi:cobalamin biosynthesis Co2+ chelatase CbiK
MAKYLITYDLVGTDENSQDYERLIEKIKAQGPPWAKVQKSVWVVKSSKSSMTIRDELSSAMDDNDRLFVVQLGSAGAWMNSICEDKFLKDFLESP